MVLVLLYNTIVRKQQHVSTAAEPKEWSRAPIRAHKRAPRARTHKHTHTHARAYTRHTLTRVWTKKKKTTAKIKLPATTTAARLRLPRARDVRAKIHDGDGTRERQPRAQKRRVTVLSYALGPPRQPARPSRRRRHRRCVVASYGATVVHEWGGINAAQ